MIYTNLSISFLAVLAHTALKKLSFRGWRDILQAFQLSHDNNNGILRIILFPAIGFYSDIRKYTRFTLLLIYPAYQLVCF